MKKVYVYARSARTENLDPQVKILEDHCKKEGIKDYVLLSEVSSGNKFLERTALLRLLQDVENELVDYVVIKEISRFGRNFEEINSIVKVLDKNNVGLVELRQPSVEMIKELEG